MLKWLLFAGAVYFLAVSITHMTMLPLRLGEGNIIMLIDFII